MSLMGKCVEFARKKIPLSILSATSTETAPDKIFIEAFKEVHVRDAINNLHMIFPGKIVMIPASERPALFDTDKARGTRIQKHEWVRMRHGLYHDDLGLVSGFTDAGQIIVKLIPRIDYSTEQKK